MIITFCVCFELNVELDGKTSRHATNVFKVATEVRSFRLRKLESAHVLGDVSDCNGYLVVLVGFNI